MVLDTFHFNTVCTSSANDTYAAHCFQQSQLFFLVTGFDRRRFLALVMAARCKKNEFDTQRYCVYVNTYLEGTFHPSKAPDWLGLSNNFLNCSYSFSFIFFQKSK